MSSFCDERLLQKLRAYARGIRQLLEPSNGSKDAPTNQQSAQDQTSVPLHAPSASPFGAVAGQLPPSSGTKSAAVAQPAPGGVPNEEWGKLMQALHGNVTGASFSSATCH